MGKESDTHNVDRIGWTGDAVRVVGEDISGLEDTLDGTGFDVELIIAETISSVNLIQQLCRLLYSSVFMLSLPLLR